MNIALYAAAAVIMAVAGHRETTALRDFSPAYDRCGSNLRRKDRGNAGSLPPPK